MPSLPFLACCFRLPAAAAPISAAFGGGPHYSLVVFHLSFLLLPPPSLLHEIGLPCQSPSAQPAPQRLCHKTNHWSADCTACRSHHLSVKTGCSYTLSTSCKLESKKQWQKEMNVGLEDERWMNEHSQDGGGVHGRGSVWADTWEGGCVFRLPTRPRPAGPLALCCCGWLLWLPVQRATTRPRPGRAAAGTHNRS